MATSQRSRPHDVIVVGTRCAGSPTAMLLARRGHRVLAVDRAKFPSDTVSTHVVQPLAVNALSRWGLLDRLVATGCPPIHTYTFDFGPFTISGSPGAEAFPVAYCARRTVLDKLLVDAAADAGAEIREGFTVDELLVEDGRVTGIRGRSSGGASVTERAQVVVGADGRHSNVAQAVRADRYRERPPLLSSYYSYWSDLPMDGRFETYYRRDRGFAAAPTHDGLTLVVAAWRHAECEVMKSDLAGNYLRVLELAPGFADRVRGARRAARIAGAAVPNFFRKPYGPGWALVGDAGYSKDPITAQGIWDAFRDAEGCATALDDVFTGARPFEDALRDYQRSRDERALPTYEFTCELAAMEPPTRERKELLRAVHGDQDAMDGFARMNAGTMSPSEFFSPENVGAILSRAGTGRGSAPAPGP